MSGPYGHGFWWLDDTTKEYVVAVDWEINSHTRQKEAHEDIPDYAKKWGFDPANLRSITNDAVPLPDGVVEKITTLFELRFPDLASIAGWIKVNYGKYGDKDEWNRHLPLMISGGYFSQEYYRARVEDCKGEIERCEGDIGRYKVEIGRCKNEIEVCMIRIENREDRIEECTHGIKDCKDEIGGFKIEIERYNGLIKAGDLGPHDTLEIDSFLAHFLAHPNAFWAGKNMGRHLQKASCGSGM